MRASMSVLQTMDSKELCNPSAQHKSTELASEVQLILFVHLPFSGVNWMSRGREQIRSV